jgi:hypothetical protein
VIIEDEAEKLIAIESNRGEIEKNWRKIKGARTDTQFDGDFDKLPGRRTGSF